MVAWTTIGIIASLLALVGAGFDRILLRRQKNTLYHALIVWWDRLDDTRVPDLPKLMADWILSASKHILKWPVISWQTAVIYIFVSFLLTTAATIFGFILDKGFFHFFPTILPTFVGYVSNLIFDLITIIATVKVIFIVKKFNPLISLIAIIGDIVIAAILAIVSLSVYVRLDDMIWEHSSLSGTSYVHKHYEDAFRKSLKNALAADGFTENTHLRIHKGITFFDYITSLPRRLRETISKGRSTEEKIVTVYAKDESTNKYKSYKVKAKNHVRWFEVMIAGTMFVPTFFYLSILLFMIISKAVLSSSRLLILHFLEVLAQNDPVKEPKEFMPGTLTGILFGIVAALANGIVQLIKLHNSM